MSNSTNDDGNAAQSTQQLPRHALSTDRVRHCRRRQREGLTLAYLELKQSEVKFLRAKQLLAHVEDDPWMIGVALCAWLDEAMPASKTE